MIHRVAELTLQKPDVAENWLHVFEFWLHFRASSLPPLHSSHRAVQFSPILGSVHRFESQNACISSHCFATSGFCNVGSHTLWNMSLCMRVSCIVLYCTVLYRIVLYCIVLCCIVLCCIILHDLIWHNITQQSTMYNNSIIDSGISVYHIMT